MGKYFVMSMRFNKCNASDFGFVSKDSNTAINPKDNSTWIKAALFDFGWGKENGFYKAPLPSFEFLFELALHSTNRDDMYGAASVILDKYADKLLCQCEVLMNDYLRKRDFKKLVELFNLRTPINRCSIDNKTCDQIQDDSTRWMKVSDIANRI